MSIGAVAIPSPRAGMIQLTCAHCGKTRTVPRQDYDPSGAVLCLTDECDRCNAGMGGFPGMSYFDSRGAELSWGDQ